MIKQCLEILKKEEEEEKQGKEEKEKEEEEEEEKKKQKQTNKSKQNKQTNKKPQKASTQTWAIGERGGSLGRKHGAGSVRQLLSVEHSELVSKANCKHNYCDLCRKIQ
jgi:FtsZ-interacting cell division protein YlmF